MNKWNLVYKENIMLDSMFDQKYSDLNDMYNKNCIELLIEFGEFINETKCFKYWTTKKPNIENVYEEAADVICMILYFYNYYNIESVKSSRMHMSNDVIYEINTLYNEMTKLLVKGNSTCTKKIFIRFIHICKLLNMSEEEIVNACYKKININRERLNSDY